MKAWAASSQGAYGAANAPDMVVAGVPVTGGGEQALDLPLEACPWGANPTLHRVAQSLPCPCWQLSYVSSYVIGMEVRRHSIGTAQQTFIESLSALWRPLTEL